MKADEIVKKILSGLEKNDGCRRKHANFWNFVEKSVKESGIADQACYEISNIYESELISWGPAENDPPDVEFNFKNGQTVAVEITELVNQNAIEIQIKNPERYSDELFRFDYPVAVEELNRILVEKEEKMRSVESLYSESILLIHTDEFLLDSDLFIGKESEIFKRSSEVFKHAFLLFSYEPLKKCCPILKLL